jgi:hypothetical protein
MDAKTQMILTVVGTGAVKKLAIVVGSMLSAHGLMRGDDVETFAAAAVALIPILVSFWQDYGKAILISQLEVMKAKSLAQAQLLRLAGEPPVTIKQIAEQTSRLTLNDTRSIAATLPAEIQRNIDPSPSPAKVVALLTIVLLGALAWPGAVSAQTRKLAAPAVTGNLGKDLNTDAQNLGIVPKSLVVTPTGNIAADLQTLWTNIVAASNVDLAYASKLAAGANTPASLVRKQCWDAIVALNAQANGLNLKDASGNPIPKPDPHLFTDVETLAEVIDNLSPQGPLFVACAGAAQLAKTNVLTFINAAVTGAAGIAAMPVIPGL